MTFLRAGLLCLLLAARLVPGAALAQQAGEKQPGNLVWFPILGYSSETKFMGGVALMYFLPRYEGERPSTAAAQFIYTQKEQIVGAVSTDLYWQKERYHFDGELSFVKFPSTFWGVGRDAPDAAEEDYTHRSVTVGLRLQRRIRPGLHLGLRYRYLNTRYSEIEPGRLLDSGALPGSGTTTVSGAGLQLAWDTRDDVIWPRAGLFLEIGANRFLDALGSDLDYGTYRTDLRLYRPVGHRAVFALRLVGDFRDGETPFFALPQLGGDSLLRGYYGGRYRDSQLLAMQAEYRLPEIWGRWGGVLFAEAGDVAPSVSGLDPGLAKLSGGFGLRWLFSAREKLYLRLDWGFGEDSSGFYISFGEAF